MPSSSNPATEFQRTGITAADPDATKVAAFSFGAADTLRVAPMCDTQGATLSVSIYLLNSVGVPVGVERASFTAQAAPDWGSAFVATPNGGDALWPVGGARSLAVKVDAVSAGTWSYAGVVD